MLEARVNVCVEASRSVDSNFLFEGLPLKENSRHTTHDKNNTTNDHTKNHPPHLTMIEGGAAAVRTTSQPFR